MKVVSYAYPFANRYRKPFHIELHRLLMEKDIAYKYYFAESSLWIRGDIDAPRWANAKKFITIHLGSAQIKYHCILTSVINNNLVILQQENALLSNYIIILTRKVLGKKTAFFGHGRNFQSRKPNGFAERFKRFWIDKVDWWFAYTPRCADIVSDSGFPRERITVFNNAIDTSAISAELAALDSGEQGKLRQALVGGSENVGVFLGGMYPDKRLGFLIDAAQYIRATVPDFNLLLIGGGEDAHIAKAAADQHEWIHYLGPKFGSEKTSLVALSKVLLMPGLVGLAVLDSFAYGTPMVTTDIPYHSPEIDYLEDGVNGVIVKDADEPQAYAEAVSRILLDSNYRELLRRGAEQAVRTYTIEEMADRFAKGVLAALKA